MRGISLDAGKNANMLLSAEVQSIRRGWSDSGQRIRLKARHPMRKQWTREMMLEVNPVEIFRQESFQNGKCRSKSTLHSESVGLGRRIRWSKCKEPTSASCVQMFALDQSHPDSMCQKVFLFLPAPLFASAHSVRPVPVSLTRPPARHLPFDQRRCVRRLQRNLRCCPNRFPNFAAENVPTLRNIVVEACTWIIRPSAANTIWHFIARSEPSSHGALPPHNRPSKCRV